MMRGIAWGVIGLSLLLCTPVQSQTRYYGSDGSYKGRETKDGRMYDNTGAYRGRVTPDGRYYDNTGAYRGKRSR